MEHLRNPVALTVGAVASSKALDQIQITGRSLPCTVASVDGQIVTVNFAMADVVLPIVTMPIATWFYIRAPVQVGDKGFAVPADAFLGQMTGLGSGTANFTQRANLATLVFVPLANTTWTAAPDPNAVCLQGVGSSGVVLKDGAGDCAFTLTSSGIVITVGSVTVTINASGVTVMGGDVTADTITLKTHLTSEVQSGGSVSGPPVP